MSTEVFFVKIDVKEPEKWAVFAKPLWPGDRVPVAAFTRAGHKCQNHEILENLNRNHIVA